MATSLAASIKNKFGLQADLIQGHDGIYEIVVNDTLVYSNTACEHPPLEEDVFAEISKYHPPLKTDVESDDYRDSLSNAPACAWTPPTTQTT
jgi:hypothetical protein